VARIPKQFSQCCSFGDGDGIDPGVTHEKRIREEGNQEIDKEENYVWNG
jgi:hypothetical protein